jgi:hypothetical protein
MDEFYFEHLKRVVAHLVASCTRFDGVSEQALFSLTHALQRCTLSAIAT